MAEEDDVSNNLVSPLHRDPGTLLNAGGNKDEESTSTAPHRVNIIFNIGPTMHETITCPGPEWSPTWINITNSAKFVYWAWRCRFKDFPLNTKILSLATFTASLGTCFDSVYNFNQYNWTKYRPPYLIRVSRLHIVVLINCNYLYVIKNSFASIQPKRTSMSAFWLWICCSDLFLNNLSSNICRWTICCGTYEIGQSDRHLS